MTDTIPTYCKRCKNKDTCQFLEKKNPVEEDYKYGGECSRCGSDMKLSENGLTYECENEECNNWFYSSS
jgi:hypothetical protein